VGEGVGCGVIVALCGVIVSSGNLAAVPGFSDGVMRLTGKRVPIGVAGYTVGSLKEAAPEGAFIERQPLSISTHKKAARGSRMILRIRRVSGCTVVYK
jgi:hypothetical protein